MTTPDIACRLLDGEQAVAHADELRALFAEVYADPPYGWGSEQAALFAKRLPVRCRQPGFVLADARSGGYLVGYAYGLPLRPSTDWWRDLATTPPAEVTTEYSGRTFAVADLAVRAPWRRQGVAGTLYDLIMADRAEERATAAVLPAATAAQGACYKWGWRKVARKQARAPGSPLLDVLVLSLLAGAGPSRLTNR